MTAITLAVSVRPLQVVYHRYSLHRLQAAIFAKPTNTSHGFVGYGNADQFKQQEEHCNRLTELGYFFHKRYEMENLPDTGEVSSAFWRLIQSEFPNRPYPTLSYPGNVLEVWDLAEYETKWDAFVEQHNVPDFAERFMIPAENGQQ